MEAFRGLGDVVLDGLYPHLRRRVEARREREASRRGLGHIPVVLPRGGPKVRAVGVAVCVISHRDRTAAVGRLLIGGVLVAVRRVDQPNSEHCVLALDRRGVVDHHQRQRVVLDDHAHTPVVVVKHVDVFGLDYDLERLGALMEVVVDKIDGEPRGVLARHDVDCAGVDGHVVDAET